MTKRKVPNIVRGGIAIPLKDKTNYYYMAGRKHKNGGIDIGDNPRTGIEVEDGEVMHITDKATTVYSAQKFLGGKSPAERVIDGENPERVFNAQEEYKRRNKINDDGTKKKRNGGMKRRNNNDSIRTELRTVSKYKAGGLYSVTSNGRTRLYQFPSTGGVQKSKSAFQRALDSAKQYINNNPETVGDTIGLVSNLIGAGISYRLNKKMLDRMKYSSQPIARQAAKLKTRININPQLDKMRESLAAYERNVRNNTASSRVALARQQQARLRAIMQANELYSSKENQETALINQDKLNQQSVRNANIADYNKWAEGKAAFENAVNTQKAENTVALLDTINAGIQDVISTRSKRSSERQTRLTMMAAYPNVNPRILRDLGIKGITDKDIENWDKAYGKK